MAGSTVAALEAGLRRRKVPSTFCGWNFSTYTVTDLQDILRAFHITAPSSALKLDLCVQLHTQRPNRSSFSTAEQAAVQAIKRARSFARGKWRPKARVPQSRLQAKTVVASDKRKEGPPNLKPVMHKKNSTEEITFTPEVENETETAITQNSHSSSSQPLMCRVCLEEITHDVRPLGPVTAECRHEHNSICNGFLEHHIRVQSDSVDLDAISCPYGNCDAVLEHNDMHQFASSDVFARYNEYVNRKALARLPTYQQCENTGCDDGCFIDKNDSFITCLSCNTITCTSCKTRYHPGMTYAENRVAIEQQQLEVRRNKGKLEEERRSKKAIERLGAKPCPGEGCGILVYKLSGCDHITYDAAISSVIYVLPIGVASSEKATIDTMKAADIIALGTVSGPCIQLGGLYLLRTGSRLELMWHL